MNLENTNCDKRTSADNDDQLIQGEIPDCNLGQMLKSKRNLDVMLAYETDIDLNVKTSNLGKTAQLRSLSISKATGVQPRNMRKVRKTERETLVTVSVQKMRLR